MFITLKQHVKSMLHTVTVVKKILIMLEHGEPPKQGARTDLMKIIEENNAEIEKIQMNASNEYALQEWI